MRTICTRELSVPGPGGQAMESVSVAVHGRRFIVSDPTVSGFCTDIVFSCLFLGTPVPRARVILESPRREHLLYGLIVVFGQYVPTPFIKPIPTHLFAFYLHPAPPPRTSRPIPSNPFQPIAALPIQSKATQYQSGPTHPIPTYSNQIQSQSTPPHHPPTPSYADLRYAVSAFVAGLVTAADSSLPPAFATVAPHARCISILSRLEGSHLGNSTAQVAGTFQKLPLFPRSSMWSSLP